MTTTPSIPCSKNGPNKTPDSERLIDRLTFSLDVNPVPKARARAAVVKGFARMYTPATTVAFEDQIATACRAAVAQHGAWPLVGCRYMYGVRVEITRPKAIGDLDNYFKAVCDGMNKIAYTDDRYIRAFSGKMEEGKGHVSVKISRVPYPKRPSHENVHWSVMLLETQLDLWRRR